MIPESNHQYNALSTENITIFCCRTDVFKYSYFPYTIFEWNKLDMQIRRSPSFFCPLKIVRPTAKATFNIHNPIVLKFLTRLKLVLTHLNKHKFKHNFQDYENLLRSYSLKIEPLSHFLLHCHHFINIHASLLDYFGFIWYKY